MAVVSSSKRPRAERRSVEERRAQLLSLATSMFAHRSYDDISIEEIAEAAGVSKGLLYHYFSSKRAFYAAAVKHAAGELLAATEPPESAPELPDPEIVRASLDAYLRYVDERAPSYRFLLQGGGDPELSAIVEDTRRRFLDRMLRELGTSDDDARTRTVARGWIGFVEATSLDWLERRDLTRTELSDLLTLAGVSMFAGVLGAGAD